MDNYDPAPDYFQFTQMGLGHASKPPKIFGIQPWGGEDVSGLKDQRPVLGADNSFSTSMLAKGEGMVRQSNQELAKQSNFMGKSFADMMATLLKRGSKPQSSTPDANSPASLS